MRKFTEALNTRARWLKLVKQRIHNGGDLFSSLLQFHIHQHIFKGYSPPFSTMSKAIHTELKLTLLYSHYRGTRSSWWTLWGCYRGERRRQCRRGSKQGSVPSWQSLATSFENAWNLQNFMLLQVMLELPGDRKVFIVKTNKLSFASLHFTLNSE